jgi:AAA+ superfamily predicted ATPase
VIVDLVVSQISPVIWNKDMLDDLVMKPRNKDLLIALISQDYRDEASADIVHGKSDGLVILLYGGPGTGKTLTAESVAERLGRPLYHVSLAEMGDDPHDAAKYLENVFYVGQT